MGSLKLPSLSLIVKVAVAIAVIALVMRFMPDSVKQWFRI